MTRARTAIGCGLALAAILGGCGADDESASTATESTELTISLDVDGPSGDPAQKAELACPGANAPPEACAAIEQLPDDPAAPVPADTPCTEIYGGPDVVTIEGTLNGEPIDAKLVRANGCEIDRFDRFVPLLRKLFPDYEPGAALRP